MDAAEVLAEVGAVEVGGGEVAEAAEEQRPAEVATRRVRQVTVPHHRRPALTATATQPHLPALQGSHQ